eukprot:CAMPEP_0194250442 /NCGR_PEP_ID=MMETSP0158-20130606/23056_1 /TAXON_ID=33649 /ORGANISM="Thalassionema nitzschioides, Strain L26-B" /LENGTH=1173 /DNA_ID=CAMNT_0038987265 /DNA_START=46 /DNA_END=3570 /DNA_ORIENTATION=-
MGGPNCSLYLAESTIKNAGFGVFAGKLFSTGDKIGEPGLGIPIIDIDPIMKDKFSPIVDYLQEPDAVGGYNEARIVDLFLPGVQSLSNYHTFFTNAMKGGLNHTESDRNVDSLAGSQTSYHGYTMIAQTDIDQGSEIFSDGPEEWLNDFNMPSIEEFTKTEKIINSLYDYHKQNPNLTEEQWIDILYRMQMDIVIKPGVQRLFPTTLEELLEMKSLGVSKTKLEPRSLEWIKQNGYCLDNIREGESKIKGAGRGAFATRAIEQGSVISPVPVVQILDRAILDLKSEGGSAASQLLLNYCFGHRKSSLLLCPTSNVALINHSSQIPNAEIRWSKPSKNRVDSDVNYRTGELKDLDIHKDNKLSFNTRLMFEVVATIDIEPGEELYLDYGSEWEAAFEEHQQQWSPPIESSYALPRELNANNTPVTLSSHLPPQYKYECRVKSENPEPTRNEYEDYNSIFQVFDDRYLLLHHKNDFKHWYPCSIVEINDDGTFMADLYSKNSFDEIVSKFKNIPRDCIRWVAAPYTSNQHLASSFRHFIPIPDSLFPYRWRSDYVRTSSLYLGRHDEGIDVELPENSYYQAEHEKVLRAAKCGVYFAPSNIPNAGFGTYTAVPLVGKGILTNTAIPAIPVNNNVPGSWSGTDYVWESAKAKADLESAGLDYKYRYSVLVVNDGALANSHPGLVNEYPTLGIYDPILDRCKDPGAGAFSDYLGNTFKTTIALGAGEELFVDYGESWFTGRKQFDDVPVHKNWLHANQILASLWSLFGPEYANFSENEVIGLLEVVKQAGVDEHRTRMALSPIHTAKELVRVIERNGTAQATTQTRSQEWFEKHGQCIDHVYVKDSTIKQAGKGNFARRFLKKKSTVLSAPLMASFGEGIMRVNFTTADDYDISRHEMNEHNLFLNYQFTHPRSSVFFFPITHAFMFNHNSKRSSEGQEPNAMLRWASWNKKSQYFLKRPLDDLKKERYSLVVLEIIATRDIEVDEEVFIDYGIEWEQAWNTHVRDWQSPCDNPNVLSSRAIRMMNDDKFNPEFHAWSESHYTVCQLASEKDPHLMHLLKEGHSPIDSDEYVFEYLGITWNHIGFNYSNPEGNTMRKPCLILNANKEKDTFEVAIFYGSTKHQSIQSRKLQLKGDLSAESLEFIDVPLRSDMHWKGGFRHPIFIPDEIFPKQWKDLP